MKMYKKSDLSLINGMLVAESGDIVMPHWPIVKQANELETIVQQAAFLEKQPEATPMPTLDGFKRMSISDHEQEFTASTPLLDMQAAESMAMMKEFDDIEVVNKANKMVEDFKLLIEFAENDYVIDCGGDMIMPFDTPVIGDVLKLTKSGVVSLIANICGLCSDDMCDRCSNDNGDNKGLPRRGMVSVPATKENLDKIMEFLDDISKPADDSGDEGSEE